jgi:hydrogenase maturation factor
MCLAVPGKILGIDLDETEAFQVFEYLREMDELKEIEENSG